MARISRLRITAYSGSVSMAVPLPVSGLQDRASATLFQACGLHLNQSAGDEQTNIASLGDGLG